MITHSRLAEVRKKLFGRKLAKRPKPPNEAERLYLGAMRVWANNFKIVVGSAIAQTYPELLDPANVRKDGDFDESKHPRDIKDQFSPVAETAARIREHGVLSAVQTRPTREAAAKYQAAHFVGKDPTEVATSKEFYSQGGMSIRVNIYPEGKAGISDGNHRIAQAVLAGATHIRADIVALGKRGGEKYLARGAVLPLGAGARTDAIRVGPLMLGKRANKILHGITNPLRAAADRVPLGQVAGTVKTHVERDVQRYMPGLKNTDLFLGSEVASWRQENTDLITNLSDEMLDRIGDLLEDYDGTRVEDIATALEDTFGLTRARAELIARDQTLKLNGQMNRRAQTAAGVESYRWSTSNDGSVRDDHDLLADQTFNWNDPPIVNQHEVDKGKPERHEHPGGDYQCRCIAIPVLEEFDDVADQVETQEFDGGDFDESKHPRDEKGQFT